MGRQVCQEHDPQVPARPRQVLCTWTTNRWVHQRNRQTPSPVLSKLVYSIPSGSTPLGMYKKLIEFHEADKLSFKYVKTFNMDEYVGLPRDHPESYHSFMWHGFFSHIDIDPANVNIPDGNAPDLQLECDQYEEKIKAAGGVDLFIGGIYGSSGTSR